MSIKETEMSIKETKMECIENVRIVVNEGGNEYLVCREDECANEIAKEKAMKTQGTHWIVAKALRGFVVEAP